jgi:signal transduction histidine kinase
MATSNRKWETEKRIADPHRVLVVSDDAEFPRQVADRWPAERTVPAFTRWGGELKHGFDRNAFDLAIVGPLRPEVRVPVLRQLDSARKPVIVISDPAQTEPSLRSLFPRMVVLSRHEGWPENLTLLAFEVLRRVDAVNRAERAEQVAAILKCHATLGQYIIEMRHTLNNALTSVLGNAELLLLEPGAFSAGVCSQIDTIRNMALRMHEILQRFSSLEKEMKFLEKQTAEEQSIATQAAAVGQ